MKKTLLATALVASFALTQPVLAHEGEKHEAVVTSSAPTSTSVTVMSTAASLAALNEGMATINALATAGKEGIHEEAEKLEQGPIASLLADTTISADKKPRLDAALKQFGEQLGKLHDAADKKDTAATTTELKKTHAALKLIEAIAK